MLLLGGLVLGISLGSVIYSDTPEATVIRVPEVRTHVVTKTRVIHKGVPQVCVQAYDEFTTVQSSNLAMTASAGQITRALDPIVQGVAGVGDMQSMTRAIQTVRDNKDRLDTASIELAESYDRAQQLMIECRSKMGEPR